MCGTRSDDLQASGYLGLPMLIVTRHTSLFLLYKAIIRQRNLSRRVSNMLKSFHELATRNCLHLHGCVWYVCQASSNSAVSSRNLFRLILCSRNALDSGDGIFTSPHDRQWIG